MTRLGLAAPTTAPLDHEVAIEDLCALAASHPVLARRASDRRSRRPRFELLAVESMLRQALGAHQETWLARGER